jgi:hemin uptake protein HemP
MVDRNPSEVSASPAAVCKKCGVGFPADPPQADSAALLGGRNELLIKDAVETYHLRLKRNNKLILTK